MTNASAHAASYSSRCEPRLSTSTIPLCQPGFFAMRNHLPIPSSQQRRRRALTVPNSMFVDEQAGKGVVEKPSSTDTCHRMHVHRVGTTGFPPRAISAGVCESIEHRTAVAELWRNKSTTTNWTVMAWRRGTSPCFVTADLFAASGRMGRRQMQVGSPASGPLAMRTTGMPGILVSAKRISVALWAAHSEACWTPPS